MGETAADVQDEYEVLMLTPVAPHRMVELKKETAPDPQSAKLINAVKNSWPESVKKRISSTSEGKLIIQDDIAYKSEKIVVPASLKSKHPGSETMKNRVRDGAVDG